MKVSYILAGLLTMTAVASAEVTSTGDLSEILNVKRTAYKGPYIGANIGYGVGKIDDATVKATVCEGAVGCTVTDFNKETSSIGGKLYGGYLFNDNFAVEGGYFNLGEISFDERASSGNTYAGSLAVQGLNINAVGYLAVKEDISLFARAGITYANMTKDYSYSSATLNSQDSDEWNAGFNYGIGLQYDVKPNLGIRLEIEDFHMSEQNSKSGFDMQLYSIGVVYSFGKEEKPEVCPEPVVIVKESEPKIIEKTVEKEVVKVVPVEKTERVVLTSDALFDYNKATIKPAGKASLKKLAANLQPDDKLVVTGYTDSIGSAKYNMKLSQRRADAVKWQLFDYGVAANRIKTKAMGEANPVATNKTAEGRALNRRVEIEIKSSTTVK